MDMEKCILMLLLYECIGFGGFHIDFFALVLLAVAHRQKII
jgi:hypothetical protein